MMMEEEKVTFGLTSPATIVEKRPSISSTKFEVRKLSAGQVSRNPIDAKRGESKLCYRMADLFMNMVIVFPLSICFWRGVWQLMDYYSEQWGVDPWLSVGTGYCIPFAMYYFQEPLRTFVMPGRMNFVKFYIISRTLLLVHSFGSVNQWRGLWKFLDDNTGIGPFSATTGLCVGLVFNIIFKTFSNVLAPPLFCVVDEAAVIHDCPLRFKTLPEQKCRYFFDCVFSVCVIPSLTVCCWRGIWNLSDYYLYPNDPFMHAVSSLVFGYVLCTFLIVIQPLICDKIYNLKGLVRITIIDMMYMWGFIGCVFAWKGVWNSLNYFIVFESEIPCLSEWVTTIVGIVGCILFGCVSTIIARGIAIDGDLAEDETAEWLIPYVSHLRTRDNDVPFPEPWICRYLCTNHKMNADKISPVKEGRRKKPGRNSRKAYASDAENSVASQPLRKINNTPNSIHPFTDEDNSKNHRSSRNAGGRIRLSQIPHIDSSSEDELGTRETMSPNEELFESHESIPKQSSLQEVVTMPFN